MKSILTLIHTLKTNSNNTSSRSILLQSIYYQMLELIVLGKYEATAELLNELRNVEFAGDDEIEAIRRFITIRLSMKRGDPGENTSWIKLSVKKDSWLSAEMLFVEGHFNFHLQFFDKGSECFYEAEKEFQILKMYGREFVSCFNGIIGEVVGTKQLAPIVQLEKLRALELRIFPHSQEKDCARVQAMIYRQKAHAFEDLNRLHASLEEISKAILIFELNGPVSDYQLALLHAADICLDLEDRFKASTFIEYLFPPVDSRIEFPLAFVNWRLGGAIPDKKTFSILPSGWVDKFDKLISESIEKECSNDWKWNLKTGVLTLPSTDNTITVKLASFEGRLLKLLVQEKATKNFLIETLWPLQGEVHLLDNRLHRLISRLNKKLKESIIYDGKYYILKIKITLH